ncbi:MAG: metal-dependent phosphohydrolase [Xanthobacteraceae bacterium]|nr:metal-dependent phosphohydrolase [Xanthobacteraceae bacterium]
MLPTTDLPAEALGEFLAAEMNRRCGASHPRLTELVPFAAQLALECIANSDALYHNVEHTMLVTLAGHDIFVGRALLSQSTPSDYAHLIIACLMHDIGYVRGILKGDGIDGYVADAHGHKVTLPRGSSDAALMPYHVERSKLFVLDRMHELDAERIARSIELTRFPAASADSPNDLDEEGLLVRAADLIGQLGDPHYLRKANALFCEFEEIGMNKKLGYESPADIIDKYPQFYWNMVSPHIQVAIRYLNVTARGRQWIANLYSNVFRAEREVRLSGPQP